LHQKGVGKARVAVTRKLGIRRDLLRDQIDYAEFCRRAALTGAPLWNGTVIDERPVDNRDGENSSI
jgi:hypothetical protein